MVKHDDTLNLKSQVSGTTLQWVQEDMQTGPGREAGTEEGHVLLAKCSQIKIIQIRIRVVVRTCNVQAVEGRRRRWAAFVLCNVMVLCSGILCPLVPACG